MLTCGGACPAPTPRARRDSKTQIRSYPNLLSWRQPDTLVFKRINGTAYLFTANEGDNKEGAWRAPHARGPVSDPWQGG